MSRVSSPIRVRVGIHVYAYYWVALILLYIVPFLVVVIGFYDPAAPGRTFVQALAGVAALHVAFWFTRRQCSAPDLSCGNGLLLITAYRTMGVGALSVLIAVPSAIVAILTSFIIALIGIVRGDSSFAPRQFRRLLAFFYRYRLYQ